MQKRSHREAYENFIQFVQSHAQAQRTDMSRRLYWVFIWCFAAPALLAGLVLVLVNVGVLPPRFRGLLEVIVLVFPVLYALYFLGSEVLGGILAAFKKGSISTFLQANVKSGRWRDETCRELVGSIHPSADELDWISKSFAIDLRLLRYRNGYLTALGGSVFFLLIQGLDLLDASETQSLEWSPETMLFLIEAGKTQIFQLIALGLFLVLLYLSGSQNHQSLARYQDCLDLLRDHPEAFK